MLTVYNVDSVMSLKFGITNVTPQVNPCALDTYCPRRGYAVDAAVFVCEYLKLNCTFTWYNQLNYGDYDEHSGNVTGLVGEIYNGHYDTTIPILTPTFSRFHAVSFSNTYFYDDVILVTRSPSLGVQEIDWGVLFAFQWPVWVSIMATLMITCCAVIAIQAKLYHSFRLGIIHFLEIGLALMTRQYTRISKRLNTAILIITFWALAFVVLTSAYTGALFSRKITITGKVPFTDLNSFVDCVAKDDCRIIVSILSNSGLQSLLNPGSDAAMKLEEPLRKNPIMVAPKAQIPEIIKSNRKQYYVWLTSKNGFAYFIQNHQNESCSFYSITTPYNDNNAFAVRKNSSVLRVLNKAANVMRASGFTDYLELKYHLHAGSSNCKGGEETNVNVHVEFTEVYIVVGFYCMGTLGGLISLLAELGTHKSK
jgi:hypothetical protein